MQHHFFLQRKQTFLSSMQMMRLFILLSFSYCIRHLRDAHNRTWNQILLRSKRVSSSNTSDLCAIVWEAIIIKNQAQVVQIFIGHVDKFWLLSELIRVKEFFKSAIVSYRFLHWLYFTRFLLVKFKTLSLSLGLYYKKISVSWVVFPWDSKENH